MADVQINEYKLMRSRKGKMLAGVAAGLAKSSGLDVTVVRLCIGATMLSGLGFAAYILMWIVLPEESASRGRVIEPAPENTARAIRITLFALAALSVFNKVGGFYPFAAPRNGGGGFGGILGLVLVGIGVSILFSRHRPDRNRWEPSGPPSSGSRPSGTPAPADGDVSPVDDEPTFDGPFRDVIGTVHSAVSEAFGEARTTVAEARPSSSQPSRPVFEDEYYVDDDDDYDAYPDVEVSPPRPVATVTSNGLASSGGAALAWARVIGWFALIWWTLAAFGLTALWFFGAVHVNAPVVLAVASWLVWTAVLNTLLHAKFARAIIPALALLLIPIAIASATVRPVGSVGETIVHPSRIGRDHSYRLAVGRIELDLGNTCFLRDQTSLSARNDIGAIFVTVPRHTDVTVNVRSDVGSYQIFGQTSDGMRPRKTMTNLASEVGGSKLTLNLRTGVGYIEVKRSSAATPTCKAA